MTQGAISVLGDIFHLEDFSEAAVLSFEGFQLKTINYTAKFSAENLFSNNDLSEI